MRLLLIRHAEPDYVRDHLTPKGLREAALLADYLSRTDVDAWYVSPLGRAQATLGPTLARTGRTAQTLLWLEEFRGRCTNPDRPDEMTFPWCLSPRTLQEHPLLMSPHRWHEDSLLYKGNTVEIYDETSQQLDALLSEHGYQRSGAVYRRTDDGEITVADATILQRWLATLPSNDAIGKPFKHN